MFANWLFGLAVLALYALTIPELVKNRREMVQNRIANPDPVDAKLRPWLYSLEPDSTGKTAYDWLVLECVLLGMVTGLYGLLIYSK